MKKNKSTAPKTAPRRKAVKKTDLQKDKPREHYAEDSKRLVTELEKQQVELEMQNEELRRMQEELAESNRILQESEEEFRTMFELSAVGMAQVDIKTNHFVRSNRKFCEITGYSAKELSKLTIAEITYPADRSWDFETIQKAMRGETAGWVSEKRYVRKNGDTIWVKVTGAVVFDDQRRPLRTIGAVEDITRRKQAEAALQDSENRYRLLFERAGDAIFILEAEGKQAGQIVAANRTAAEMHGYADGELLARSIAELDAPDAAREAAGLIKRMLAGEWIKKEISHRRKDGSIFPCEISAGLLEFSDHKYILAFDRDVTERKEAENLGKALNEINEVIHSTLETGTVLKKALAESSKALGAESAALSLRRGERWVVDYGYGVSQEIVGAEMNDEEEPHALLALRTKRPVPINDALNDDRVNRKHMKKFGIRSVLAVPLLSEDSPLGVIFFNYHAAATTFTRAQVDFAYKLASSLSLAVRNAGLFEDMQHELAARKKLEEALKQSNAELETVNKELEAFAATVSNDLRAPLRSIEGFIQALVEDRGDRLDEVGRDYCRRVYSASRRMAQLIEAMQFMASLTSGELREQVVNLSAAAQVAVYELKKKEPGRQVDFAIAEGVKAKGDTDMLRLAIENLLDNAWKFTAKHQSAKIEFGVAEIRGEKAYYVRDNGAGFPMEYAGRLFQPFQRLHASAEFPGIGIGLAIAHNIIRRHGGRMWAEAEVERGATFYFTL